MRFVILTVLAFATALLVSSPSKATTISGEVQASDGDTFEFLELGIRIRVFGLDTPESKQQCRNAKDMCYACGSEAAAHLKSLIKDKPVTCVATGDETYGRSVASCKSADGIDLAEAMISAGWGMPYFQYLDEDQNSNLINAFESAKKAKRGIHQGKFEYPWRWRRGSRDFAKCGD